MTEFILLRFTDLENSLAHNEDCYIICTISGLCYDCGIIPTAQVKIDPDYISVETRMQHLVFQVDDWKDVYKYGEVYEYNLDDDNGITISFPF